MSVFDVVVSVLVVVELAELLLGVLEELLLGVPLAPIELVPDLSELLVFEVVPLAPMLLVLSFLSVLLALALLSVAVLLEVDGVAEPEADGVVELELLLDVWARATPPRASAAAVASVVNVCLVVIIRNSFREIPQGNRLEEAGA